MVNSIQSAEASTDSAYYFTLDQSTQIVLCGADCMADITNNTHAVY